MSDKMPTDNYHEETVPLFKLLRTAAFRFVIVHYNHFSLVRRLEADLRERFPDRPFFKTDAQKINYQQFSAYYAQLGSGFFWIENFDDLLKTDLDSQGKEPPARAKNNERRRHLTAGLNLRRDKLAQSPIALFVFLPTGAGQQSIRTLMEKMPDLWSFRSFILDLELQKQAAQSSVLPSLPDPQNLDTPILDETTLARTQAELQRLLAQLDNTPETERAYRLTLFPQIVDAQIQIGHYSQALQTLDTWEMAAPEADHAEINLKKGDLFTTTGLLDEALRAFEKALAAFQVSNDKYNIARIIERIGSTHTALGNLDKALIFNEKANETIKTLYKSYPNNVSFKNGLAISYSKLGETHSALGNLDKALNFYEEDLKLTKDLYETYPNNVEFKNGLAISYSKLGETHSTLGNLDKALHFYEQYNQLKAALYESFPNNVDFKNGLAISYSKLGETHSTLGNLDKALKFYEEFNRLASALYESYPNKVSFKNGLAVSYSKLGDTLTALGNLDKALHFYEQYNQLIEELHNAYPQNVEFKLNYGWANQFLGITNTSLGDLNKGLVYFEKMNQLFEELYESYPNNVSFENGLAISYQYLGNTQTALGNLDAALRHYEFYCKFKRDLYESYPTNVSFKNGLAISYEKLGSTQSALGNLDKALYYFEQFNQLMEELHSAYPQNIEFKLNYGWANQFLGIINTSLGDLNKGLVYFEKMNQLFESLYESYPNNVSFKNGLAISYAKLAQFSRDQLKDHTKAKGYFQQAEKLWLELVRDAPQYVQFQQFLKKVRKDLADLE